MVTDRKILAGIALVALLGSAGAHTAAPRGSRPGPDKDQATTQLRIEVTGGDENKPVADASVYVRFPENPKKQNGKQAELDLKTNQEGITRSPEVPQGKILIQTICSGWKTYGEWYDVEQDQQTIKIHLVRPATKWY